VRRACDDAPLGVPVRLGGCRPRHAIGYWVNHRASEPSSSAELGSPNYAKWYLTNVEASHK
jgi:hypothetical protein